MVTSGPVSQNTKPVSNVERLERRRFARGTCDIPAQAEVNEGISMSRLMGLAVFGERVAARTYALMAKLRPQEAGLLRTFAQMEGQHGLWFSEVCKANGIAPDRDFADHELGYLITQVDAHYAAGDFAALAVLQGFIVECLAISTYAPFLDIADRYPGMKEVFARALEEEHYHVRWVTAFLKQEFEGRGEDLMAVVTRVNTQGVDCVGGTLMNITDYLTCVGLSGADCAGAMADEYTQLLERVGIDQRSATRNVVSLFVPLIRKYRRGEKTK